MNDIVYLVYKSTGAWDDYHQWVERVYQSKSRAEEYILRYNDKLNSLKEKIEQYLPKDEDGETIYDFSSYRYSKVVEMSNLWIQECKTY